MASPGKAQCLVHRKKRMCTALGCMNMANNTQGFCAHHSARRRFHTHNAQSNRTLDDGHRTWPNTPRPASDFDHESHAAGENALGTFEGDAKLMALSPECQWITTVLESLNSTAMADRNTAVGALGCTWQGDINVDALDFSMLRI
ncbi:Aste57867_19893 [Aphanomyces stellatus]|uniref:Aste57867_19893 protein n=1 Tax=Aphanomyces stellatus TaxID=120398 RepID=A0A485LDU1_9STRA|nr:hypothetical protein As57867_019827 [Aphanomyces stellatus]VFT96591.1 Aste57867_19893 [Aphanomyces stellatus]